MKTIRAAVGVLQQKDGKILIAKRQKGQLMAGFWELPGGKIEADETPKNAAIRELREELGIEVEALSLHKTMQQKYQNRIVELHIFNIEKYQNQPAGIEGQTIAWSSINLLKNYQLLPTMKAFIASITLPKKYWITPSKNHQSTEWLAKFEQKLRQNIRLIQLRSKTALDECFIKELSRKCQQHSVKLLLNTPDKTFTQTYVDGFHLTTSELLKLSHRPCSDDKFLGASAHNLDDAKYAEKIGADFIVISPVQPTKTHPNAIPIGWENAHQVANSLNIPVYFLGGMGEKDLAKTIELGAQGIAGVSAF